MKHFVLFLILISPSLLAEEEYRISSGGQSSLYPGSDHPSGRIEGLTVYKMGKTPQGLGPFYVWQPRNDGGVILLTNVLSALDELLRVEFKSTSANPQKLRKEVYAVIESYSKNHGNTLLYGKVLDSYVAALRKKVDPKQMAKLEPMFTPSIDSVDAGMWKIGFTIITSRGAIERLTLSGKINPVTAEKEEREVVAPAGTLPKLDWAPTAYPED